MRALVVGLGSAGRRHARNWTALGLGEVAVLRQTDTPQPEPLGVPAALFRDLDEALAWGPDVAIVCNPSSLHVPTALAAVRAGCHVLVEKPLGASLEGVSELLAEADRRGRHLFVGYNLRFHPGLVRLRALLHAGAIGRPLCARAEMGEYLPGWHPWEDYRQGYSARRDQGGGPILTFSHELDSVCWLLGRPVQVMCLAARASSLEIDTEDIAEIALRFEGGALASIHVDYVRQPPRRFVEVTGEEGVLRWDYDDNRLLVYPSASRQWRVEQGSPTFERNHMFLDELRHLAAYARGDVARPTVDGRQGAAILAVALAALQSAREGRALDIEFAHDVPGEAAEWLSNLSLPSPPSRPSPSPTSSALTAV